MVSETHGVHWEAPEALKQRPPSRPMRVAEYRLGPEDAPATLTVFAGFGGSVEDNISRWVGQFKTPSGEAAKGAVTSHEGAFSTTSVFVQGVYQGGPPMMGGGGPQPDMAMRGAVVEGPDGLVFFKLIGPKKVVQEAETLFHELLASVAPS